nr:uncharacterized protein LOC113826394 [Penaeus vannamei]
MTIDKTFEQIFFPLTALIERSVQLSFTGVPEEDLMITADFSETSLTMEAKLYTNSEDLTPNPLTCEITGRSPKTCTFKVEPKVTEFKILLMALDSESTVKDSTVVEFEDFQTRIQQLTLDAIEVRWRASQNQEYDVEIVSETDGKIDSTSVICGGEKPEDSKVCLAYFFPLNLNKDYTASVRVQGDNKYVSASVRMQPVLETINIKELTLTTTGETRGLTVCFMESREKRKQNEGEKIVNKFVAVDANGRQVQMVSKSSHSSVSDVEEKLCLGPLPLDLDFNLSDKVRVLVSRENLDTQEILLSGDAELFVSDPPPKDDKVVIVISVVGVVVAVVAIGSLGAISLMKSKNEKGNLRRQEEPPLTLPVYATWGARRLGRTAQPPREHEDCTNNESAKTQCSPTPRHEKRLRCSRRHRRPPPEVIPGLHHQARPVPTTRKMVEAAFIHTTNNINTLRGDVNYPRSSLTYYRHDLTT